jgi:arylsulfatase A
MMKHLLALLTLVIGTCALRAQDGEKPNIILIFADDLGYADIGSFGAKGFKTPHLDKMAAEGLRLTSFYTGCPVCSGSRAALLTGRHYQRVGVPAVMFPGNKNGLNPNEITIATLLRRHGYFCAIIGKWHLGHLPPYLPTKHGFHHYFGIPYSNDMTIDPVNAKFAKDAVFREGKTEDIVRKEGAVKNTVPLMRGEEVVEYPADQSTLTKRYAAEAVKLIKENKDKPFFIYMPHTMPHVPLYASAEFKKRTPTVFGDVMEELDASVGTVLKAVKETGLSRKTLVIFTSDNGAHQGSAAPLRGKKATVYEGGYRVPFVAWWEGKIPPGTSSDEVAATVDMLPTFAKLAGGGAPDDRPIDGKDIRPLLFGAPGAKSPHEHYVLLHGNGAVRSGKWKFYPWPEGLDPKGKKKLPEKGAKTQLYDLSTDISESKNLAEQHPEIVARLTDVYNRFADDVKKNKLPAEK